MSAHDVAIRLDLKKGRRGWRGNCPACGYRDSFMLREIDGRVSGWCVSCQDRTGIDGLVADVLGGAEPSPAPSQPTRPEPSPAARTAKAMTVWNGAVPLVGTPAELYVASRGLASLSASPALRWRPDVRHPESDGLHPAMVALIQDVDGHPVAVHRHYLTRDGRKADLVPPKASSGPVRGGVVRLDPIGPEMVVGEGVESAASAGQLFSLPALAAISAGNLQWSLELPAEVRSVVIAADHDPLDQRSGRRPGQCAAHAAAQRWQAQGRRVRIALPDREGVDFNDLLQRRLGVVAAHG